MSAGAARVGGRPGVEALGRVKLRAIWRRFGSAG